MIAKRMTDPQRALEKAWEEWKESNEGWETISTGAATWQDLKEKVRVALLAGVKIGRLLQLDEDHAVILTLAEEAAKRGGQTIVGPALQRVAKQLKERKGGDASCPKTQPMRDSVTK